MLVSLVTPPVAASASARAATGLPRAGATESIAGSFFCVARPWSDRSDNIPREQWLESRTEEEKSEFVAAIDVDGASSLSFAPLAARALSVDLTGCDRHLAWHPSAHAFSASVHPIRC